MRPTIAGPDFRRDQDDYRVTVMQAMRVCRQTAALSVVEWAAVLGVLPAAVRAYEDGRNCPTADVWLQAIEMAGCPALQRTQRWTQRGARRLANEGVLSLPVAR